MNRIQIEETKKSPKVDLNPITGKAFFSGRSIHSDAFEFYEEIINWFKINGENFDLLDVEFAFDHINTVTNKCILQILLMMKNLEEKGKKVKVDWVYDEDDDDMLETGEELEILCDIKFNYKTV